MRIKTFKSLIALLLILNTPFVKAETYPVKKEKKISKLYNVNADAGINIKNKYGNIYVTTWDESQIAIDVVITVEGKSEDKVNRRLDAITIEFEALKALISAKTVFGSSSENKINMQINYTIKMPRKGGVRLDNQYGNINLERISGIANIECQYGNVTAGELQADQSTIRLKYCDRSTIGYAKGITVDSQYSGLTIKRVENLVYKGDYSNFTSQDAGNVIYNGDYGELSLGDANNITLKGNYLSIKVGKLNGNFASNTDYSSIAIGVDAKANNLAINAAYTTVEVKYDSDYSFDFDIALRYTELKSSGLTFQSKKEGNTSATYKGFYKIAGKNKLNIALEYGEVKLTKI